MDAVRRGEAPLRAVIPPALAGLRLDQALARMFHDYSRTRLKDWIVAGRLRVDDAPKRPRDPVTGGEVVELWPDPTPVVEDRAQPIGLAVLYEDPELLVIDKPAGLVVHPGAGNRQGTLLNALLHHDVALEALARAGIVHRLDKDTSGLMVVARSARAQRRLIEALRRHEVRRGYRAVVQGTMIAGGRVDAPLGRHPHERLRMAVNARGKAAVTHYRVVRRFRGHTLIEVTLETGRTHQIRVHMAHIGHPIVGDPVYGGRLKRPAGMSEAAARCLLEFQRQALHAYRLSFPHPLDGRHSSFEAPLPEDMAQLVETLSEDVR